MRMTPDGSRFYSSWLEEGDGGSDIMFRRLTPKEFSGNNATPDFTLQPLWRSGPAGAVSHPVPTRSPPGGRLGARPFFNTHEIFSPSVAPALAGTIYAFSPLDTAQWLF